jgi:hypothetical protein
MNQDQFNSLLVERATRAAHHRTAIDFIINFPFDSEFDEDNLWTSDEDDEDSLVYTEEAQKVFDFYYNEYYDQLINTYKITLT